MVVYCVWYVPCCCLHGVIKHDDDDDDDSLEDIKVRHNFTTGTLKLGV